FGTHELKPEMTAPIAWTWSNKWGGRTFTTSLGHPHDFESRQSMRVMVNGTLWSAGQNVLTASTEVQTFSIKESTSNVSNENKTTRRSESATLSDPLLHSKLQPERGTIFYGNSFMERLQEDGTLEALLHSAKAGERHRFRSLAYTGDEVGFRIRPDKFGDHLGYVVSQFSADRVVMCFGMNEAFEGLDGIPKFSKKLELYLSIIKDRHPRSDLVLVSPTAVAESSAGEFPDAVKRNADIATYCKVMQQVAEKNGVAYIDLFGPSKRLFVEHKFPLTTNGLHLNSAGNQAIASILAGALSSSEQVSTVDTSSVGFESLRRLVSRKAYEAAMAHHPANGIHYYGIRGRPFEYNTEIPHHFKLAEQLDEAIWNQAANLNIAQSFPKLPIIQAEPPAKRPRKGLGTIQQTQQDLANFEVAEGFGVNLFASSEDFPELINPLQMNFDSRGRLWVACFESYPVPLPGTLSKDKILIFEDTDGDGKADRKTVFADDLKLPDGFVFYKDGIIVSVSRKLIWMRDTNGDDVVDIQEELLRGIDDTDTHHGGYLARTPQGHVVFCEGVFHRGQFETPYGPVRTKDATALYFDPVTRALSIERQTNHPNPWKISFNQWGESMQMFGGGQIIDCDYYNILTPIGTSSSSSMGMPFRDDKGCTLIFVSSSHFPEEWQGGLITGHLLAKNAVLYTPLEIVDGTYVKGGDSLNLLSSPNKVFRPTDLAFGLDGALYISDFYYPIIGHAQHSIRDVNRDYSNGRIWRLTRKGTPLNNAPEIYGMPVVDLFSWLTHSQIRVRELVREELEKRPRSSVLAVAKSLVRNAEENETLGLELLWLFERLKDYSQKDLLRQLAKSKNVNVQRAAARSLRWWAPSLGGEAIVLAGELIQSADERTKIAIVSVASHLQREDHSWMELIDQVKATPSTPLDKVIALASLHDSPPINPEFPLLKVEDETRLSGWLMNPSGIGGSIWLKSDQTQDLVLGYRGNPYMNLNLNNIPLQRATGSVHSKHGQINVTIQPGINKIEFFSEMGGKPRKGSTDLYLANLVGAKSQSIIFAPDETEHRVWADIYGSENATVTDNRIYLKTVPAKMAFNVTEITVKAGRRYQFILENPDFMLHNLVVTQPGKETAVGEMADAMAAQPDAMAKHYVPDTDMIIFATPQIAQGQKVEMEFTTPSEPGIYPFICTFPGHWRIMRGAMVVE
ncbi:GDSL-type esterase/lipase family protein, partial [bacterium]|nr:GDSL-type esterase/lipase family protein [bacterium]